jgi:hypothetical protein
MSWFSISFIIVLLISGLYTSLQSIFDPRGLYVKRKQKAIHRLIGFDENPINETISSCVAGILLLGFCVFTGYDLVKYLRVLYNF